MISNIPIGARTALLILATTVAIGCLSGELRAAHEAPPPRDRAAVEAVLDAAPKASLEQEMRTLNIV